MLPLILLAVGSLVAWGAWGYVVLRFDPLTGGLIAHLLFYASLALAFLGSLILAGMVWHRRRSGMTASKVEIGIIARQAFLLVTFVIVVLNLAAARLLRWWNILPLALLTLTLELFFMSLHKRRSTRYAPEQTIR